MIRHLIFASLFVLGSAAVASMPSTGDAKPIHITEPLLTLDR